MAQLHAGIWLAAALYAMAAISCAWTARSLGPEQGPAPRERALWWLICGVLLALALFRLADLQTLLAALGRGAARRQGWYEEHRIVQFGFILLVAGAGIAAVRAVFRRIGRLTPPSRAALAAAALLVIYVLVRATSFHPFDRLIGMRFFGLPLNWLLEACGLAAILAASLWRRRYGAHKLP